MTTSEEQLMAWVDGECTPQERLLLEASAATDPGLFRRYAAQRALRDRLRLYFNAVTREPVPQRLLDATLPPQRRRLRPAWLAIAASLAGGMILGAFILKPGVTAQSVLRKGELMADTTLAQTLSHALAADPSSGPIRIGVSFVSNTGQYCRTFIDGRERDKVAGLACHHGDTWRLKILESSTETLTDRASYTQAATHLSPTMLQAAEALMSGDPLDAAGEAAARARGWKASDAAD